MFSLLSSELFCLIHDFKVAKSGYSTPGKAIRKIETVTQNPTRSAKTITSSSAHVTIRHGLFFSGLPETVVFEGVTRNQDGFGCVGRNGYMKRNEPPSGGVAVAESGRIWDNRDRNRPEE